MRKILLFAVLLLILTLLPTVPVVAPKPPGKPPKEEEIYLVTFTGPDITSGEFELTSQSARGKGGKHLAVLTRQGEYTTLNFVGEFWGDWAGEHDDGRVRLDINLKFNEVGMVYFFDYSEPEEPLDFWWIISNDGRRHEIGEWIPYEGKDGGIARFEDDPFEIVRYSAQGDITILDLTFDVTIEPKP